MVTAPVAADASTVVVLDPRVPAKVIPAGPAIVRVAGFVVFNVKLFVTDPFELIVRDSIPAAIVIGLVPPVTFVTFKVAASVVPTTPAAVQLNVLPVVPALFATLRVVPRSSDENVTRNDELVLVTEVTPVEADKFTVAVAVELLTFMFSTFDILGVTSPVIIATIVSSPAPISMESKDCQV
jgi:hypothetical protein